MDDRRSADRTRTSKAASILFGRQAGEHSCEVEVKDLGNGGAGIYKSGLAILPLTFDLSLDNLRRRCRMVWRRGNFFGVTFEDRGSPIGPVAELVGIEVGVVSGVMNLESSGVEASDWRPRHEEVYHDA
jgi:hypothetical protein